jgi:hypothetical protein
VELRECHTKVEVDRVGEAKELAALVTDISVVIVDQGLDPIQWIPQVPSKARYVLEVVGAVLEQLCEVPSSVIEALAQEGEQLIIVVVRHLVACYWSAD